MKNTLLIFVAVATLVFFSSNRVMAQKEKGESVVTLGVAASLPGLLFKVVQNAVTSVPGNAVLELKSTPGLQGMYDYALTDRFSLGVACSFQSYSANYTNYQYDTSSVTLDPDFTDRLNRLNLAVRPLIHMGNSDNVDTYLGVRLGYTSWNIRSTSTDPNWLSTKSSYGGFNSRMRIQPLFGLRYFFTDNIGINGELAIGSPYFMMGGLNIKF